MRRIAERTAVALAVAGITAMLISTGAASWPLALAWCGAIPVGARAWEGLRTHPTARLAGVVGVLLMLVLLTWEGGLFLVPGALVLLVLAVPPFPGEGSARRDAALAQV